MAKKRNGTPFRTEGSGAVDPAWYDGWETIPRPLPRWQPEEMPLPRSRSKQAPKSAPKPRTQVQVSLFGVVGFAVAGFMLVLVLFGYWQVYDSACQVGDLQQQVQQLREENQRLQNQYDTSIDLEQVEARARELGMQQPSGKQLVSLRIPEEDVAVISGSTDSGFLQNAWEAVLETVRSLWEYLR